MTGPEQHAATVREALPSPEGHEPNCPCSVGRAHAALDELVALAGRADEQRWLAWSGGDYPDDSPGDVISADADGTIVLDDGITTWNPKRAAAWFKARADELQRERDVYKDTSRQRYGLLIEAERDFEQARREADQLRAALRGFVEFSENLAVEEGSPFIALYAQGRAALAGVQADTGSEGGSNREHLSSAKAAAPLGPEADNKDSA